MGDHELRLFQSIGLSEAKAKETAKNATLSKTLAWIISEVEFDHVMSIYLCTYQYIAPPPLGII